jgi:hypothetical protein
LCITDKISSKLTTASADHWQPSLGFDVLVSLQKPELRRGYRQLDELSDNKEEI